MPRGDQRSRQWQLLQMINRAQGVTADAARDALDIAGEGRTVTRTRG